MADLEPTTPQEYILKGVVNAVLGQDQGIVRHILLFTTLQFICLLFTCNMHMSRLVFIRNVCWYA